MSAYRGRVLRGSSVLPNDWYQRTNPDTLDISNANTCTLGQLYGGFTNGLRELQSVVDASEQADSGWISAYGFNGPNRDDQDALTEAWQELIAELRLKELTVERELVAV